MQTDLETQELIADFGHQSQFGRLLKRTFDVFFALLLLMLSSPFLVLIAVLIKLSSKGPIIYSQNRIGSERITKAGKTYWRLKAFKMHKFRSMRTNADSGTHRNYIEAYIKGDKAQMQNFQTGEGAASYKLAKDPRITTIGHYLRLLSLDELPQLWNILKGEMSFVGPRPPIDYELNAYQQEDFRRLATVPGLTGLWQVSGRTTTSFKEMVALDLKYIKEQSFWLDLKIVVMTIPAVFSKEGAG